MATHTIHHTKDDLYFVTFTCYKWLPLLDEADIYDYLPLWAKNMREKGVEICAYVFMPNHVHLMVYVNEFSAGLNSVIGDSKRFLAYQIVRNLQDLGKNDLLLTLHSAVRSRERQKGKKHHVFRDSFDAKLLAADDDVEEVLHYIHMNPVTGKWKLTGDHLNFPFSSVGFFELDKQGFIPLRKLDDIWQYPDVYNAETKKFEPAVD